MSDKSGQHDSRRGTTEDERTLLLRYYDQSRGKGATIKLDRIKGCLLWAGERNPCWALVPLLRDGGDVGMVWRWERFVWEANEWDPFAWIWRTLVGLFSCPLWLVKWLAGYLGLGFGDVEDQDEKNGDLD